MKIVIPTAGKKLCGHFGHCECFTFVDVDMEKGEIVNIEEKTPEEGISCQSAYWISEQGADVILAGGMGGRPMNIFLQTGIQVFSGCPELPIEEIVNSFIKNALERGENPCGGEHHHCNGEHGGHCHHNEILE